jgi:hypothetical protein
MQRTHDKNHFYKLVTRDIAKIIIEHRTIRWRTPLQFNDPFDTQTRLTAEVDPETFAERFVQRLGELALGPDVPSFYDQHNKLHQSVVRTLDKLHPEERGKALEHLRASALQAGKKLSGLLEQLSEQLAQQLQHGRVFCLTESINNVVMWSHYAEEHRGVGFKLRVLDDIDHPFRIARPVIYSDSYVCVGDSEQMADHFTRAAPIDLAELSWKIVYLKHSDWRYEKEWRCYRPMLSEPVGTGYEDHVQDPRLFEAIYFGCNMGKRDREELMELSARFLPNAEIFIARKSAASFDLVFDRIR